MHKEPLLTIPLTWLGIGKPLTIHLFGILLMLAFIFAIGMSSRLLKKEGEEEDTIFNLALFVLIGAIIGARAFFVVQFWSDPGVFNQETKGFWDIVNINSGGIVYYGGLIGGFLVGILYLKWKKVSLLKYGDAIAPAIALGTAFGRLGCFMNGCCFGKVCSAAWPFGVSFPPDSLVASHHRSEGLIDFGMWSARVHPTQLYSVLIEASLCLFLYIAYRRWRNRDGDILFLWFLLYPILRFGIEAVRADNASNIFGLFTISQVLSLLLVPLGLFWWGRKLLTRSGDPEKLDEKEEPV